jgi:hypothetical protein
MKGKTEDEIIAAQDLALQTKQYATNYYKQDKLQMQIMSTI